jgi:phenylalanyl-tRNA synthetase beta chain
MRLRLRDAGQRPISNAVDITNYVMLELGQPLHAFDLDRIADETIVVRCAAEGERLTTLDGVERTLSAEDLLIAGIDEPLGLAGVMGGGDSEVSAATDRVLIEVAHFEPTRVLLSGKRHALRTEAVARFERGVDPEMPPVASDRAATLLARLGGGTVVGGFVDEHPSPPELPVIELPAAEAERLLGVAIPATDQAGYLRRLGFTVVDGDPMTVTVPPYRVYDVSRRADLIEEIARLYGYNEIPARLSIGNGGGLSAEERLRRRTASAMAGAGFFEVMNFDWVAGSDLDALGLDPGDPRLSPVRIRNPMNEEQEYLRTTLVPGLLGNLRRSAQRNRPDAAVFEIGTVFLRTDADLPEQPKHLGFAATGNRSSSLLDGGDRFDARDAVGTMEVLGRVLRVPLRLEQRPVAGLHPGRSVEVLVDGSVVGFAGEVDPDVATVWDLERRVIVGEVDLGALGVAVPEDFEVPSPYPPAVFDLAFDVAEEVAAGDVLAAVRRGAGPDLEALDVFDVFRGAPLEADRKSIAVRLSMRNPERTLTDEEIAPVRAAIEREVADAVGGVLRGG